jgi:hypothetical protein
MLSFKTSKNRFQVRCNYLETVYLFFQLAEELESLEVESEKPKMPNKKNLVLNLDAAKKCGKENSDDSTTWILLDVNFGIPLFDTSLNQKICHRIVANELWKPERYFYVFNSMLIELRYLFFL